MRIQLPQTVPICLLAVLACQLARSLPHLGAASPPGVGIAKRVPWTTSRIAGSPEPPLPYTTERAFPALQFSNCLDMATPPGSKRCFIVEQRGKIFSFPAVSDVAAADLAVDLAEQIPGVTSTYALTFHPDFQRNRYCYICYITAPNADDATHIARFTVSDADPPTIDVASAKTIITWQSGGHNGCCLKFGPDGYLYISTGDAGPPNPPDANHVGQDISNLLSCILRIDVDHPEDGQSYRIPTDNPFVDWANARGEIWAYGFRNPWRMSFDRKTGALWVGDVGWELWEMLNRVERGGNYGWSVLEGRQPANPESPRGPTPILPPTIEHSHTESSSITDGLTYYGRRLRELHGTHLYGDYDTGKIWGFRDQQGRIVDHRELADTAHRIVGFGEDHLGEVYLLDHTAGTIHRLVPNPDQDRAPTFPRRLSESGLFDSVPGLIPAAGVVRYSINAEPWEDHAVADRWIALPHTSSIDTTTTPAWSFPEGAVLAKTLSLDIRSGDPSSRRRVETQILHFDGHVWHPYTYRWNDQQSDATLVAASGDTATFEISAADPTRGPRIQQWRFSSRSECLRCHNIWSGPPLAFNAPQLNKPHDYPAGRVDQLATLAHIGFLEQSLSAAEQPSLARPDDKSADLGDRARGYLQVNCAHCHRLHAGSAVLSYMHYDLSLKATNMVGTRPTQGTFGIPAARVVAAGDPYRSVLLYRLATLGAGHMPHIGATEIDLDGVELIDAWIRSIPTDLDNDSQAERVAIRKRQEDASDLERLRDSGDSSEQAAIVERLLSTTSGALMLLRAIDKQTLRAETVPLAIARATGHDDLRIRGLFERFVPSEDRIKRLGTAIEPDSILAVEGDASRGKQLFFDAAGVQCKNCHRVGDRGQGIGPELTRIGSKLSREQLLEAILEPSARIDPEFVTYLAETVEGRLVSGILVEKSPREVVLRDAQNNLVRIAPQSIEQLAPQSRSLMPELLVRDMTAQQVADMLAYLGSLK